MCISFDPEIIYNNAFYAVERDKILYKGDIVKFCNILENEILKDSKVNKKYRYVYFDFNKDTLSSFYEAYFGIFNIIGDTIYLSKIIDDISKVNIGYDDYVKKALDNARIIFKNSKSQGCPV